MSYLEPTIPDPDDVNDAQYSTKDTTSHLYRLVPEVKEFILLSINFIERIPIGFDPALVVKSRLALDRKIIPEFNINNKSEQTQNPIDTTDALKEAIAKNEFIMAKRTLESEINSIDDITLKEKLRKILDKLPKSI